MAITSQEFTEKYTTDALDKKKTLLSNDAYAIGEMIDKLTKLIVSFR